MSRTPKRAQRPPSRQKCASALAQALAGLAIVERRARVLGATGPIENDRKALLDVVAHARRDVAHFLGLEPASEIDSIPLIEKAVKLAQREPRRSR